MSTVLTFHPKENGWRWGEVVGTGKGQLLSRVSQSLDNQKPLFGLEQQEIDDPNTRAKNKRIFR